MSNSSNFAETLNELIIVRDLSPKQIAEAISLSVKTIYSWMNNTNYPTLSNIIALSDYFRVPLDFLAGRSDKTEPFYSMPCPPFPQRLRHVMKEKGISTYFMRKNTRFGAGCFSKWDDGADPLLPTLIELGNILECSIDYLVGRES